MKKTWISLLLCLVSLTGCSGQAQKTDRPADPVTYQQISAQEAKTRMEGQQDFILLDVRTQAEYDEGHIEDAILIPDDEVADRAAEELPDSDAVILVYCRSGHRSKLAAQELADLGYTNVYEFGGIINWPYDIVK